MTRPFPSPPRASRKFLGLERRVALAYGVLFLLAFAVYATIWRDAPLGGIDTPRYVDAARDLADLKVDQLQFRTPGYPLLLLATGSVEKQGKLLFYVALALHFAAVWLVGTVLDSLSFRRWSVVGVAVALLLPPFVENAAYVLSEDLTQFTLVCGFAGVFHWFRNRSVLWLAMSALAFAYAGLTRPTYQALAFAISGTLAVCWRVFQQRGRDLARAAAALTLVSTALVGGYATFNYFKFGFWGVTPMLGFHLSTKTIRVLERIPDRDQEVRDILIKHRDAHLTRPHSSHTGYMYIWSAIPELQQATGMSTAELSRHMTKVNLRLIASAPLEYLIEVLRASGAYWLPAVTPVASLDSRALQSFWSLLHFGLVAAFFLQGFLVAGAAAYLGARWRRLKSGGTLLAAIGPSAGDWVAYLLSATLVVYTMLVSVLVESGVSRVRTPSDIFMVVMIVVGMRIWSRQVSRNEVAGVVARGAALGIGSLHREASIR